MTHLRPTRKELHALAQDEQRSIANRAERSARVGDCVKCRSRGPVFTAACLERSPTAEFCEVCVTFEIAQHDRAQQDAKRAAADSFFGAHEEDLDNDE